MAMTSLCIRLEARSPAHRCFRAYEVAAGVDLFGAWLVAMSYGRIGTSGRTKTRSSPVAEEARAQVVACLRKRASAPRRIGVAYRVRSAVRSEEWCEHELDERLRAWFPGCDDGRSSDRDLT
jgi:predicted DNA-binding WGR domain protein